MTPFFDPRRCPICAANLPVRPLRCPTCGAELTGPVVAELAVTLRLADSLAERVRAEMSAAAVPRSPSPTHPPVGAPPARSWFAGKSVGVILLILGVLCVLAAGAVFIAVAWTLLPLAVRALILIVVTASFGLLAQLALRRGLQATAEAMAVIACGMFVLDLAAARSAGLLGLDELTIATFGIVAGALLMVVAGAGGFAARKGQRWLWSLDAAVACGMASGVAGLMNLGSFTSYTPDVYDVSDPYDWHALTSVAATILVSLLYLLWRRVRLQVAMWASVVLGAIAWLAAVEAGIGGAADYVGAARLGDDLGRLASAWPALAVGLLAGVWSVLLKPQIWRRVAACLCLLPALLVFEVVGWSHGWVVGTVVMLVAYVIAALASGHLPDIWSRAVGVCALVLGLSSAVGLLPTLLALAARMGLASAGTWAGSDGLSLDRWSLDLLSADVAPWLLPVTTLAVLLLLPQVTVGRYRLSLDLHRTEAAFIATLSVVPILYGASFWVSIIVLVAVAAVLICGARLWRDDVLLLLGLLLLAIMRVCAYYDDLADPLAWTVVALACLGWALTERRAAVGAGFLTAAGLFALLGAVQWLTFAQAPRTYQGLVIVAVGSLGLLASQWLLAAPLPASRQAVASNLPGSAGLSGRASQGLSGRALSRLVCEGLSVTWVVAGVFAANSSPSHRSAELTVAGAAAGITGYLSQDRRRAGWVSGVLLTVASWIRLADNDIQAVEWYTLPAATALLIYGARRLRRGDIQSGESPGAEPVQRAPTAHWNASSWRCLGPGLALALVPSLIVALDEPVSWRGLLVGLAAVAMLALGVQLRLAAPFALGAVATGLLALRNVWPVAAFLPRWTLLFVIGGVLLTMGMTWESRVADVRTAGRYVRGLR